MRILILDGNPDDQNRAFEGYVQEVGAGLESSGHEVKRLALRGMDVRSCTGCFSCWLKTPGECVISDDAVAICREYVNADFVLLASPMIMGFVSAVLKRAMDRVVPLVLPYFEFVNGEMHHAGRYEEYPRLGLLIEKSAETDDEDIGLTTKIFERCAVNAKSELCFSEVMGQSPGDVVDAINGL